MNSYLISPSAVQLKRSDHFDGWPAL